MTILPAFLDSPIQLLIAAVVILVVFGPDKLPQMLKQLGSGIREFKRYTSELSNSMKFDDEPKYSTGYQPPRYDAYGNPVDTPVPPNAVPPAISSSQPSSYSAVTNNRPTASGGPIGDFASAAFGGDEPVPAPPPSSPAPAIKPAANAASQPVDSYNVTNHNN
jgi:TatA/E family protein of Tat protein translocase